MNSKGWEKIWAPVAGKLLDKLIDLIFLSAKKDLDIKTEVREVTDSLSKEEDDSTTVVGVSGKF